MKTASFFLAIFTSVFIFAEAGAVDSTSEIKNVEPARKYFEIIEGTTKVFKFVDPQSPIIGFANKNETYPLVFAGTSWAKIIYKNDTGWVERIRGRTVNTPTVISAKIPRIIIILLFSACIAAVLVLVTLFVIMRMKRQKFRKTSLKRDLLIISPVEKEVRYSFTEASTTLTKCFSETGFKVSTARDLDHARTLLIHYAPDVLVVDWNLERGIQTTIQSILYSKEKTSSILVIFYNVPDPAEAAKRNRIRTFHFVGLVFTDRDIFKIIMPLLAGGKSSTAFKKSVQSAALEGEIGEGNLVEVLQFIEIGKKTGCLYFTLAQKPIGIIYFEQGRITYAASHARQGRDAVNDILNFTEGGFHFVLDKATSKRNVNVSTLEVLMDWTKVKDETRRY